MAQLILAIDQGTTGTTALLLDENLAVRGKGYREIPQSYPAPGWVEHDPEAIWLSVLAAVAEARAQAGTGTIAGIGIANQRETVLCWDRATGKAVAPAIVWQDRRTGDRCEALRAAGLEATFERSTGLLLNPYFSGTKMAWLLDNIAGLRRRAEAGSVAFGTIDSFLVWRLSGGRSFVTDVSNASRTLLLDIGNLAWNPDLCRLLSVPAAALPRVIPSAGPCATTSGMEQIADGTPIAGIAGDQQAALFGQGCLAPGDAKCTFGTGAFLLMNVGARPIHSRHGLLATVAWQTPRGTDYALEGSAFVAGALVQWLRDGLGIIKSAPESEGLAASVPDTGGVTVVPALAGLGAPHWRPEARGLIYGISRGTTAGHIARAALEAIVLQNVDLVRAMERDAGRAITSLRVDGGAATNDLLMQMQADLLGTDIVRPAMVESTALGAGRLAALGLGLESPHETGPNLQVSIFHPRIAPAEREERLARWRDALARC
ncbi:MAG: glycerol kinase GlpK [Deltaproteobacteria bacterium]|nr:glycerol kinase GlpK [Deltaproteobacteria bacterium]